MPAVVNTTAILDMQYKLYRWSRMQPDKVFDDLFNLVIDRRTIRLAWERLSKNKGSQTPGTDGVTRRRIEGRPGGVALFLEELHLELKSGSYGPIPVREKLIPKANKPGKFRPLGIPSLRDRLVQMCLKLILEPIFEADFFPTSYGFRRGRCTMDAISAIQAQLNPTTSGRSSVEWIIEGDIKACFDNVDHHILLNRVRARIGDRKVIDLIRAFLKAGVMAEGTVRHPVAGTPQGGIISPLLANIYLQAIDERYRRWIPSPNETKARAQARRWNDRRKGRPTFYLVRYADDFVVCVAGSREDAEKEKTDLAQFLRETLHMELSLEKSLITDPADGFEFLGYRIVREASSHTGLQVAKTRIPKAKLQLIRDRLKHMTERSTIGQSLETLLKTINPIIVGWRNYYRFAVGAWKEFMRLDWWLWQRVQIWLRKKHPKAIAHAIRRQYAVIDRGRNTWGEAGTVLKPFKSSPSTWYRNRGTKISNGWNDKIDNVTSNLKVSELNIGYTDIGEMFR